MENQGLNIWRDTAEFHLCQSGNELYINGDIDKKNKVVNEEGGFRHKASGNTCTN